VEFRTECRYWRGDKPCREKRLCEGCPAFEPLGEKILIVKLGARGDVLRTTPLVAGLRRQYPQAHITWLTNPEAVELLRGLPGLDKILAYGAGSVVEILSREFDRVLCFDKDSPATGLASLARAPRKFGFGLAPNGTGTPYAFNAEAEYALALGVSDDLKFRRNTRSYMEVIFEASGLTYRGEPYVLALDPPDREAAARFLQRQGIRLRPGRAAPILGLFTGCGPAFPHKRWTAEGLAQLARKAQRDLKARVLLLGGPDERALNARIKRLSRVRLLDTAGKHTLRELGGFLEACRVVVTGDTLALHMALALRRPTLALFGPTCPQEVDLFGLGEKIVTPLECAPCYLPACDRRPDCMQAISLRRVWASVLRLWKAGA